MTASSPSETLSSARVEQTESTGACGADADWVTPGRHGTPADAMARLSSICRTTEDLHACMLVVLATHQAVPRDILAMAVKQFRADVGDLSSGDLVALLTGLWNGGKQGFDAILRARRTKERKAVTLPWAGV